MDQLISIGIGVFAILGAVIGLVFGLLKKGEKAGKMEAHNESLRAGAKESQALADRLAAGHNAAGGVRDYSNDPNDRANRRKRDS